MEDARQINAELLRVSQSGIQVWRLIFEELSSVVGLLCLICYEDLKMAGLWKAQEAGRGQEGCDDLFPRHSSGYCSDSYWYAGFRNSSWSIERVLRITYFRLSNHRDESILEGVLGLPNRSNRMEAPHCYVVRMKQDMATEMISPWKVAQ